MIAFWILVAAVSAGFLFVASRYFSLWLQAYISGARFSLASLILMSLRKVDPKVIVRCRIMAVQAELPEFPTQAIESQYLAGGNVQRVTLALIAANRAGIDLDWDTAAAIDLAGRDVLDAVRVSVNPKVINCPQAGDIHGATLDGIAKDGIQLKVRVRVTVRTNLLQLIGGATEETIVARVGQGIITSIGSCETYMDALSDPMVITRQVIKKGLDSQTAFAIVSIDIFDINVGENIGAKLQVDQAEADIRHAIALAEKRRATAVALRQEMVALKCKHRAALVRAEARIPAAISAAFRRGAMNPPERPPNVSGKAVPIVFDFPHLPAVNDWMET